MTKGLIKGLLGTLILGFAVQASAAEMIRYEHDLYKSDDKAQHIKEKTQDVRWKQSQPNRNAVEKPSEHPVYDNRFRDR